MHGISADDIDIVINTHMHIDHCANNHLFKNARYIVPAEEIGYLKTLFSSSKEEAECFFRMLYPSLNERFIKTYVKLLFASKNAVDWMFFHPNVQRVSGDMFLTNHIQLITTYGHCPGHICVVVENDENEFHCISGDILIDPQDDVNQDGVQHIVSDKQALMESKKKLKSMVSYVFPGHGNSFNASVAI